MAKYTPKTKEELQKLVRDESIYLGDIDTSAITDMSFLFAMSTRKDFSGIGTWDTSSVVNMRCMFLRAKHFNHNISSWDTSSVVDMGGMFYNATYFNQNISSWDTSSVVNMSDMFYNAKHFNQNLDAWDTSSVRNNLEMFDGSGIKSLPKWWKKKEVESDEKHKWIDEVMEKTAQAEQTKGFAKIALIAFAVLFVISFVFNFINGDDETSTPKQSSAQTQQNPRPQETQRLESTNSAQISPEQSESIKSDTANTPSDESQTSEQSLNVGENSTQSVPSDESVNLNENSSENVAQNSAQDDTPSESVNLTPSQNTKPSFDCDKASTNAEKIVCSDDELARLDNELANAYKNALNSLDNASKKQLTNEQKSWLKTYNQCTDKECVKYHLQMRIWAL